MNPSVIKVIDGYENYAVSDDGRVYSKAKGLWTEKTRSLAQNGYYAVWLYKNNEPKYAYVHHLVLSAFDGPKPKGKEALHIDGVRTNNHKNNLRWGSRKENVADAMKHGTFTTGTRNGGAKLSYEDVRDIRGMWDQGYSVKGIMNIHHVSDTTIRRVLNKETYKDVD